MDSKDNIIRNGLSSGSIGQGNHQFLTQIVFTKVLLCTPKFVNVPLAFYGPNLEHEVGLAPSQPEGVRGI